MCLSMRWARESRDEMTRGDEIVEKRLQRREKREERLYWEPESGQLLNDCFDPSHTHILTQLPCYFKFDQVRSASQPFFRVQIYSFLSLLFTVRLAYSLAFHLSSFFSLCLNVLTVSISLNRFTGENRIWVHSTVRGKALRYLNKGQHYGTKCLRSMANCSRSHMEPW